MSSKIPEGPAAGDADLDFEKSLAELEAIVERLERGDLPLEESLQQFERGIALTRQCQGALGKAEQKVELLLRRAGPGDAADERAPFEPDNDT